MEGSYFKMKICKSKRRYKLTIQRKYILEIAKDSSLLKEHQTSRILWNNIIDSDKKRKIELVHDKKHLF